MVGLRKSVCGMEKRLLITLAAYFIQNQMIKDNILIKEPKRNFFIENLYYNGNMAGGLER
ncbi:hypothetical protein [Sporolactobacillus laevolacticus]|uniref:Uncharacterized protein n=1 Tax=Sporolactobacillus laevolacticus DSM 442 TaxID=1395513 RepID=V6J607_9BACL|nr:hypothetical protein [Sporolactobacillus laevolacticus]EST12194.1 hypothetical protein P343_07710 [Sporolactobacillus laevolacticus DSM 442]